MLRKLLLFNPLAAGLVALGRVIEEGRSLLMAESRRRWATEAHRYRPVFPPGSALIEAEIASQEHRRREAERAGAPNPSDDQTPPSQVEGRK